MTIYKHTQVGTVIVLASGIALAVMLIIIFYAGEDAWAAWISFLLLLPVVFLFGWLTIEVTEDRLIWKFGIGLISKSVNRLDIKAVRIVTNPWWYGFGIRLTPHGWLYNVSGPHAVEIELINKKKFRLGTDQPEELHRMLVS